MTALLCCEIDRWENSPIKVADGQILRPVGVRLDRKDIFLPRYHPWKGWRQLNYGTAGPCVDMPYLRAWERWFDKYDGAPPEGIYELVGDDMVPHECKGCDE